MTPKTMTRKSPVRRDMAVPMATIRVSLNKDEG